MRVSARKDTADGGVVIEFHLTDSENEDLARALRMSEEKALPPPVWVPLADRPGMPTSAPKPPPAIRREIATALAPGRRRPLRRDS